MTSEWKRTVSRYVEKYVVNPQLRIALRLGLAPGNFALLETTGRRTGILRQTPVGNGVDGDTFWLVAEHGHRCGYVRNLTANPQVRVRANGVWRTGTAHLLPDDDALARRRWIDAAHGISGKIDGWIFEKTATRPLAIRIDLDPHSRPGSGDRE